MTRRLRLLAFSLAVLSLPLAARADDASRRAKAQEMIETLHLERVVDSMLINVMHQTSEITARRYGGAMSPDTQAALAAFQKKLSDFVEPQIGWKAVEPEYIKLYADSFTDEELDGILAFYRSPSGKALLEKMPAINQKGNEMMQARIVALQPQVKEMFNAFEKSLPPGAAAAPPALSSPAPAKSTPK